MLKCVLAMLLLYIQEPFNLSVSTQTHWSGQTLLEVHLLFKRTIYYITIKSSLLALPCARRTAIECRPFFKVTVMDRQSGDMQSTGHTIRLTNVMYPLQTSDFRICGLSFVQSLLSCDHTLLDNHPIEPFWTNKVSVLVVIWWCVCCEWALMSLSLMTPRPFSPQLVRMSCFSNFEQKPEMNRLFGKCSHRPSSLWH